MSKLYQITRKTTMHEMLFWRDFYRCMCQTPALGSCSPTWACFCVTPSLVPWLACGSCTRQHHTTNLWATSWKTQKLTSSSMQYPMLNSCLLLTPSQSATRCPEMTVTLSLNGLTKHCSTNANPLPPACSRLVILGWGVIITETDIVCIALRGIAL